jgi:DNA-binding MarR family transcriptional regulator
MKINESIKQLEFEDSQTKAWVNLMYTHNQLMDQTSQVFKKFGITRQQYNVLRILKGKDKSPATCGEVKRVMLDKNPDLSRLGDRLVAKGLILRVLNENNRREMELSISQKGLDLLQQMYPELKKNIKVLHNLSDEEAEHLSTLLDKLRG